MADPDDVRSRSWSATTDVAVPYRGVATFGGPRDPGGTAAAVRAFTRRYGWRAYALPILALVTVLALLTARNAKAPHPAGGSRAGGPVVPVAPPTASGDIALKSDQPSANSLDTAAAADALPAGVAYTTKGNGTFRVLKGAGKAVGTGRLFRYAIEVEGGITGVDLAQYAREVQSVLADARSWSGHGVSLQRIDSGHVDFHVDLTSSLTVRRLCGYAIPTETSCYAAAGTVTSLRVNRVVLNIARWVRGDQAYVGDLAAYRIYMINHEDGHALGHQHAHECLSNGLAPAMMQQTFGLKAATTGKLCEANPWPYPAGARDAPGAEQPDTASNDEYNLQNS